MDEHLINMINQYADGELDKNSEAALFVLLSKNIEARDYFRNLQSLKTVISETREEVPEELEERILRSVANRKRAKVSLMRGQTLASGISYAFAIILLILCAYVFIELKSYQNRFESVSNQLNVQNRTIEMLYNSLPALEVTEQLKNKIIITSKL